MSIWHTDSFNKDDSVFNSTELVNTFQGMNVYFIYYYLSVIICTCILYTHKTLLNSKILINCIGIPLYQHRFILFFMYNRYRFGIILIIISNRHYLNNIFFTDKFKVIPGPKYRRFSNTMKTGKYFVWVDLICLYDMRYSA